MKRHFFIIFAAYFFIIGATVGAKVQSYSVDLNILNTAGGNGGIAVIAGTQATSLEFPKA